MKTDLGDEDGIRDLLPLSASRLYILLALAGRPFYGYGLMQQAAADSGCNIKLGPAAVYGGLERLSRQGLVRPAGQIASDRSPHQRQLFEISKLGRQVLETELDRLNLAVRLGRGRLKS